MVGAAERTRAKPVGGAAPTRALGITASWGLRISRPQAHPGLGPAPPVPGAGSVLCNSEVRGAAFAAPGPDNGCSGGAKPEVRLRMRSLSPVTAGPRRAREYTSQRPPRMGPTETAW